MNVPDPNPLPYSRIALGKRYGLILAIACAGLLIAVGYVRLHTTHLKAELVRAQPNVILNDPTLLRFAETQGSALYQQHCASCHGTHLEGNQRNGAPNLADGVWLYDQGLITDIETTILYGIRSGHPKAHNLTDMPGLGRTGKLTSQDIHDVVEYVLQLSQRPHDSAAAARGHAVFHDTGLCYDCHGNDGEGVSDYGTPALTGRGGAWLYGGDRDALYKSIDDGRHGLCPAWIGTLDFAQIRALAVYLYKASHS